MPNLVGEEQQCNYCKRYEGELMRQGIYLNLPNSTCKECHQMLQRGEDPAKRASLIKDAQLSKRRAHLASYLAIEKFREDYGHYITMLTEGAEPGDLGIESSEAITIIVDMLQTVNSVPEIVVPELTESDEPEAD